MNGDRSALLPSLPPKNGYTHWALTEYLSVNFSSPLWVLIHLILTVTAKREVQLLFQCCIWRTQRVLSIRARSQSSGKMTETQVVWPDNLLITTFHILNTQTALYNCTQHCYNLWTVHCYWVPLSFLDDILKVGKQGWWIFTKSMIVIITWSM